MGTIRRLVLRNFKRFKALELEFDSELNILVGGNEAGKSSVLQALDIALSASRSKVEAIGIEALFNADCIAEFLLGSRKIAFAVDRDVVFGDDNVGLDAGLRAGTDIELVAVQRIVHRLEDVVLEFRFGLAVLEGVQIALRDARMRRVHRARVLARGVLVVDERAVNHQVPQRLLVGKDRFVREG